VIEGSSAVGEDTTGVERPVLGVDGDGDYVLDGSGGKSLKRVLGDVGEVSLGDLGVSGFVSAVLVDGVVGVDGGLFLGLDLDVSESVVHETSVATVVSVGGGAIDELLFGEVEKVALILSPSGLERGDSGESPA